MARFIRESTRASSARVSGRKCRSDGIGTIAEAGATSWRQLTDERRQPFIRALVRQVRYDGRNGQVTVQFDNGELGETATDEATDRIDGEGNGNEPRNWSSVPAAPRAAK